MNVVEDRLEKGRQEALARLATPPADVMLSIGAAQLAEWISPRVVPIEVVDAAFAKAGARTRDVLSAFLWGECLRFVGQNGAFRGVLARDKAHYLAVVDPLLRAHGCSVEDWVSHLRQRAGGRGPDREDDAMDDLNLDLRAEMITKDASDGWAEFEGVASSPNEDLTGDTLQAGCFDPVDVAATAMLRAHNGAEPIGKWTSIRTVAGRLAARGKFRLTLAKGREAYDPIKHQIVSGLSVGFRTLPGGMTVDRQGNRTIRKATSARSASSPCRATILRE